MNEERYKVELIEDNHVLPRGEFTDMKEAERAARRCVDDVMPRNCGLVSRMVNGVWVRFARAYFCGDGSTGWEYLKDHNVP